MRRAEVGSRNALPPREEVGRSHTGPQEAEGPDGDSRAGKARRSAEEVAGGSDSNCL